MSFSFLHFKETLTIAILRLLAISLVSIAASGIVCGFIIHGSFFIHEKTPLAETHFDVRFTSIVSFKFEMLKSPDSGFRSSRPTETAWGIERSPSVEGGFFIPYVSYTLEPPPLGLSQFRLDLPYLSVGILGLLFWKLARYIRGRSPRQSVPGGFPVWQGETGGDKMGKA